MSSNPSTAEALARLCWPDAVVHPGRHEDGLCVTVTFPPRMGATFDPTTDANDWERVLAVLSERGLLPRYGGEMFSRGKRTVAEAIFTAPLPDRCAAALVVLAQHEQKENN